MEQVEATPVETQKAPRRSDAILVIAGTVMVLGGFLYWTGATLGLYQGSSLLRSASAQLMARIDPSHEKAPKPEKLIEPTPESRLAVLKTAAAPLPQPTQRQLLVPDPFREPGRSIFPAIFSPAKPLDPAARKALEERSVVSKSELPDGRLHLSITMNPAAPAPAPAPVKAAPKKTAPKGKPAASLWWGSAVEAFAVAGLDLE